MDQEIILARECGLLPDTGKDAGEALRAIVRAHARNARIELAPGRYDFFAENGASYRISLSNADPMECRSAAVYLRGCEHLTIAGNGAQFVLHGRVSALVLDGCADVAAENLSVDWDVPLSSEGTVVESGVGWFDVCIDPERYPHHVENHTLLFDGEGWCDPLLSLTEFDGTTLRIPAGTGDTLGALSAEPMDGRVRLTCPRPNPPKAGDIVVLRHSDRSHPAIIVHASRRVSLSGVTIYASAGVGVLSQFSEDLTYSGIVIRANPKRGRKVLSAHVDGLHCSNLRGRLTVAGCYFHGLMDDPINVHGTSTVVDSVADSRTVIGRFGHKKSFALDRWAFPGDCVSLMDARTMHGYAKAQVQSFEPLDAFHFRLTFSGALPDLLRVGGVMENLSATPEVIVRDSFFGSGRARGLLLSSPRPVQILNNVFESSGSAILMAGDANYWYESGACHDVCIRGNTFNRCLTSRYQFGGGVISLWPEIPAPDARCPFHTGVRVEHNTFLLTGDQPALYAASADDLRFADNLALFTDAAHLDAPLIQADGCGLIAENNREIR